MAQTADEQFDFESEKLNSANVYFPSSGIQHEPGSMERSPPGVPEPLQEDPQISDVVLFAAEPELNFLQISYLHRTVRDYLEQQIVWGQLLSFIKDAKFDAKTALLAAYALEVKTIGLLSALHPTPLHCSVYDFGIQIFSRVGRLAPLTSHTHVEVLKEISTAIGVHWIGDASKTSAVSIPTTSDSGPLPQKFHTYIGIISTAMQILLRRCIEGRLDILTISREPPDTSFLAYALGVEFWVVGETAYRAAEPDLETVETLLRLGCNPNNVYKAERTIWEWILSYVHTLAHVQVYRHGSSKPEMKTLRLWYKITKLLLEHGANPSACCVKSYHSWYLDLHRSFLHRKGPPVFDANAPLQPQNYGPSVRRAEKEQLLLRGRGIRPVPFGTEKYHSVTTVVRQVFMGMTPVTGAKDLLTFLGKRQVAAREISHLHSINPDQQGSEGAKASSKNRRSTPVQPGKGRARTSIAQSDG